MRDRTYVEDSFKRNYHVETDVCSFYGCPLGAGRCPFPCGSLTVCDYHIKSERPFFPVQIKTEQQTKNGSIERVEKKSILGSSTLRKIYLFGCVTSQSRREGSSLCHEGSFVVMHGLSSYSSWTQ